MRQQPLTAFLRSNYTQQAIKRITNEQYEQYKDAEIEQLAIDAMDRARNLSDRQLTHWLDKKKGLTPVIKQLPYERFSWEFYSIYYLVPTLWVSDLPHEITHGNLQDVREFAREPANSQRARTFFNKINRLRILTNVSQLPILVVEPSSTQRSDRRMHSPDPENPAPPPYCDVQYLKEGKAYIEDGNHRAVSRILQSSCTQIEVIKFNRR